MNNLPTLSAEDKERMLQQAAESREQKRKWAENNLRTSYPDEPHWQALASEYNIRLPVWYAPATETKHIRRLFKTMGMDVKEYVDAMGCKSLNELVSLNPEYNAKAVVGLALEYIDEQKSAKNKA